MRGAGWHSSLMMRTHIHTLSKAWPPFIWEPKSLVFMMLVCCSIACFLTHRKFFLSALSALNLVLHHLARNRSWATAEHPFWKELLTSRCCCYNRQYQEILRFLASCPIREASPSRSPRQFFSWPCQFRQHPLSTQSQICKIPPNTVQTPKTCVYLLAYINKYARVSQTIYMCVCDLHLWADHRICVSPDWHLQDVHSQGSWGGKLENVESGWQLVFF